VQERLERIGQVFLMGYHAALLESTSPAKKAASTGHDLAALAQQLNQVRSELRGFAYEGAGMALFLEDSLSVHGQRFARFLAGPGSSHVYMLHVGAGWACARLPWMRRRIEAVAEKMHPVFRGLMIDGYGFHEGYFHARKYLGSSWKISGLSGDARHMFFQGFGRSLWFVNCADTNGIARAIACLPPEYHDDAWSGIGLASAYAGGTSSASFSHLIRQSGVHGMALAQGAAFAAKARQLANNLAQHTEAACNAFCAMSADEAAAQCDQTFAQLRLDGHWPYQQWRRLLQESLLAHTQLLSRGKVYESGSTQLVETESF
jgi:hypothetical protein